MFIIWIRKRIVNRVGEGPKCKRVNVEDSHERRENQHISFGVAYTKDLN